MDKGLLHLYWGEGKGKTTAAMGLAVRALGAGLQVSIVQFLKNGQSGELVPLKNLGAVIYTGEAGTKFVSQMTEEEKETVRKRQNEQLLEALASPCDMLILDEACAALELGMIDEKLLQRAVLERPFAREVILTGRSPAQWMKDAADYSTEMVCHKHPYDKGIMARRGVEF